MNINLLIQMRRFAIDHSSIINHQHSVTVEGTGGTGAAGFLTTGTVSLQWLINLAEVGGTKK